MNELLKMGTGQDLTVYIFKSIGPFHRGKQEHSSRVVLDPGRTFKSPADFLNVLCLITADQLNQHLVMGESRYL